ncbi:hypothetical protein ACA910_020494 [Epithemia clementina (nom. ined.)]
MIATEITWTALGASGHEFFVQATCSKCQVWIEVDGCVITLKNQTDLRNGSVVAGFEAHGCRFLVKISAGDSTRAYWNGSARCLALYNDERPGEAIRPRGKYQIQHFQRWKVEWNHTLYFVRAICAEGEIRVLLDGREITTPETRTKAQNNAMVKFEDLHGHRVAVKLSARGLGGTAKTLYLDVDGEVVKPPLLNPLSPSAVCSPPPPNAAQTFAQILAEVEEGKNSDSLDELLDKLSERVTNIHEFKLVYTATNMSFKNEWIDKEKRRSTIVRIFQRAASENFYYDQDSKVVSRLSAALKKAASDGIICNNEETQLYNEHIKCNVFKSERFMILEETLVQHGKLINTLKASIKQIDDKNKLKSKATFVVRSICALIPIVGEMAGTLGASFATFCVESASGDLLNALDAIFDFSDLEAVRTAVKDHLKNTWEDQIKDATNTYLTDLVLKKGRLSQDPAVAALQVSHSLNSSGQMLQNEQTNLNCHHHSSTSNNSNRSPRSQTEQASPSTKPDPPGLSCLNRPMSPITNQFDSPCFTKQYWHLPPTKSCDDDAVD